MEEETCDGPDRRAFLFTVWPDSEFMHLALEIRNSQPQLSFNDRITASPLLAAAAPHAIVLKGLCLCLGSDSGSRQRQRAAPLTHSPLIHQPYSFQLPIACVTGARPAAAADSRQGHDWHKTRHKQRTSQCRRRRCCSKICSLLQMPSS
jgi:hypothetical protein